MAGKYPHDAFHIMGEYPGAGFAMPKAYVLLVVDDETEFIEVMAERLAIRGYQVFCSSTGEDALAQLEKETDIDVTVLDLKMPGMGGIEILAEIKKRHPLVQVIMLTGYATVPSAIESMKLGAFDYVVKPYDTERLIALINEAATTKKNMPLRSSMRARYHISPSATVNNS
jgi:DNA-binding NtrC family response regulator